MHQPPRLRGDGGLALIELLSAVIVSDPPIDASNSDEDDPGRTALAVGLLVGATVHLVSAVNGKRAVRRSRCRHP